MPVSLQTQIKLPKLPSRERSGVPRSQAERLWLISGGIIAFVMLLIGYFFFISPERSNTSDVKGQVASTKQQNAVLQARLDALSEQNKSIDKYKAELAQARLALPSTSGVPDFLRTLQVLGNATNTNVTALSVSPPAPVVAPAPVAGTDPTAADSTTSAEPTPTATTAAPTAAVAPVYSLDISTTVTGSPSALISFLDQLQSVQPRAVLITKITESAATSENGKPAADSTTLQLTMEAYVKPDNAPPNASLSTASASPSPASS